MPAVTKPPFGYSGCYYWELLEELKRWRRIDCPEITDEDPNEPFTQILKAFALVTHLSHGLLDHVALETLLGTCRLRESAKRHLALIGYQVKEATPSTARLIGRLAQPLAANATLLEGTRASTTATETTPAIDWELLADVPLYASLLLSQCWELDGAVLTNRTTKANTDSDTFQPWGGNPVAQDSLVFGHRTSKWNRIDLVLTVEGDIWSAYHHVWEYWDSQWNQENPDLVDVAGSTLSMDLTTLLGTYARTGATVRVTSTETGRWKDVTSLWNGAAPFAGKNYLTVSAIDLGLTAPYSTTVSEYLVGTQWREPESLSETGTLQKVVTFALPENEERTWVPESLATLLPGATDVDGFWMRLRIVSSTPTTSPTFDRVKITEGDQYVEWMATQGRSVSDDPAAHGTGAPWTAVRSSWDGVIEGSVEVFVDEGTGWIPWVEVDDFLSSQSTDLAFVVSHDDDGVAYVLFGDGTNGRIPPAGCIVRLDYRIDAVSDGNVASERISTLRGASGIVAQVWNPRAASGWSAPEGSTASSLERLKIDGPRNLQSLDRVLTADDAETEAVDWTDTDGTSPIVRAHGIEDWAGAKTLKIVTVEASGGTPLPAAVLARLETHFNGDDQLGTSGIMPFNSQATVVRYTPKTIGVTATVQGNGIIDPDADAIEAHLGEFLSALAVESDGTWIHSFGGSVDYERVIHEIFEGDPGKVKKATAVLVNGAAVDVVLGAEELPVPGVITITVA